MPKKSKTKDGDTVARVEPSAIQLPLFAPTHAIFEDRVIEEVKTQGDQTITKKVTVGTSSLGTLSVFDQLIYFALLYLWEQHGRPERSFKVSLRQIANLANTGWGSKQLEAIKDSLLRLRRVSVNFQNVLHDKVKDKTVENLNDFSFLSWVKIFSIKEEQNPRNPTGESEIEIHSFIIQNLKARYFRPVLLNVLASLSSAHHKMAYLYLDRMTSNPSSNFSISAEGLLRNLGIHTDRYKYSSRRKEFLDNLVEKLQGIPIWRGNLRLTIGKMKNDKDWKLTVTCISKNPPDQSFEDVPVALLQQEGPEPVGNQTLIEPETFCKLVLDKFGLNRPPTSREIRAMKEQIASYSITHEIGVFLADYFFEDARRTRFPVRDVRAINTYLVGGMAKFLEKSKTVDPSHPVTILPDDLDSEEMGFVAAKIWNEFSETEKEALYARKTAEFTKDVSNKELLESMDETNRTNTILELIFKDLFSQWVVKMNSA